MPKIKKDEYKLSDDQLLQPILWLYQRDLPRIPDTSTQTLEIACGPGRSKRVKSWGHSGQAQTHWLVTRGGLGLHTDSSYARYTHHLVVRNDGFRLVGWEDGGTDHWPPLGPGSYYCLDTHSPHAVVLDERIASASPSYKVQVAVDSDDPLPPDLVWELCTAKLGDDVAAGAATVKRTPPRTGKKDVSDWTWGLLE